MRILNSFHPVPGSRLDCFFCSPTATRLREMADVLIVGGLRPRPGGPAINSRVAFIDLNFGRICTNLDPANLSGLLSATCLSVDS